MTKPVLAGLDIGTSKIRCVLFNIKGNPLFNYSIKTPTVKKIDGIYNPVDEIYSIIIKILKKVFYFSKNKDLLIKSISISSVGEAGVPVDNNLKALIDIIPWYDQRTENIRNNFFKKNNDIKIYENTGLNLDHFYSVYKILWIKKNKLNIYKKIYKWLPVNDYYAMKLTGNISTDYSQAMRTLLFDPKKLKWSKIMIGKFGIDQNILPKIINAGDKKGVFNDQIKNILKIKYDCVVAAGGHDHFVGIFALGGFNKNTIVNSLGSAEAISISTEKFFSNKNLKKGKFISGVFKTKTKANYYIVGSILTSGIVIDWFKKNFNIKSFNELNKMTKKVRDKNISFFPQFEFSHSPINSLKTKGAIFGINRSTSIMDIYASILRCLSFDTKNALVFMIKNSKIKITKIISSGGSVKNKYWMKMRANIFDKNIYIDRNIENVSLGSAILAGIASNIYRDDNDAFKKIKNNFLIIKKDEKEINDNILLFNKYKKNIKKIVSLNNIL